MTTFSFTTERAREIVSNITANTDFLQIPPAELRGRELERESRKLVSWELHAATLAEYCRLHRIPRGLRVNLRPTFFCENLEYCTQFANILNKCSNDLMVLTIEYLSKAITETAEKINSIELQLKDCLSTEDLTALKSKVDRTCTDLKKSIENTKRNKFQRDSEDYQTRRVYRWQDSSGTATPLSRRPARRTDSQSSGSGSDCTTGNRRPYPFLGRGQRRTGRIPGGQEAIIGGIDAPRTTRSQKT